VNVVVRAIAIALLLRAGAAAAINCTVSNTSFVFGLYSPAAAAPLDVTGSIDVRCTATGGSFVATLSTGGSGTFAQRRMIFGPYRLNYNLYTNPSRTTIWGDGTGGSSVSGGVKPRPGLENFTLSVYGRVFPRQDVGAGAYGDNVLITIVF
jgi:spore coat protein U-like protein